MKSSLNFDDDFDKGFAFSILTTDSGGRISVSNPDRFTMLVDIGASDHVVDSKLTQVIARRHDRVPKPRPTEARCDHRQQDCVRDSNGKNLRIHHQPTKTAYPCTHRRNGGCRDGSPPFFSARAIKSGVNTILETGNPHLQFDRKTSLLLNQHKEDAGMCSFDVSLRAMDGVTYVKPKNTLSTPLVALAAQATADPGTGDWDT